MPTFVLYYPEKKKRWEVSTPRERLTIGRAPDADIRIPLAGVSKKHAVIERKGGRYSFRDLGSRNGIYLNGFRIERGAITDGDELQVGGVFITFYRGTPPPASRSSQPEGPEEADAEESLDLSAEDDLLRALDSGGDPEIDTLALPDHESGESPPVVSSLPSAPSAETALSEKTGSNSQQEAPPPSDPGDAEITLFPEEDGEDPDLDLPDEAPHTISPRPRAHRRGQHVHARPRGGARLDIPVPGLVLIMVCCVGVGILLGRLGSWLEGPSRDSGDRGHQGAGAPRGGDGDEFPGSPISVDDSEAVERVIVRLFLDILGRPPLRDELREVLSRVRRSGLLEEIWFRVDSRRMKEGLPQVEVDEAFHRFLGRPGRPGETEKLLSISQGDPNYFIFHLVTSSTYASTQHRRVRSHEQLARSLYADLLDSVPTEEQSKTVIEALQAGNGGLAEVARLLVGSKQATAGPSHNEAPEKWCRAAYLRFLLRSPTEDETAGAVATLESSSTGWQEVLLDLATRPEYREY